MDVDLRSLRAFLNVIDAGGFSAAARVHGISQPALSRTIKQLEEQVGARLFDRDTRNLTVTAVGRELQTATERLINDFNGSLARISELSKGTRGAVVVASIPTLASTLVPPAIASFSKTHGEVGVFVQDAFTEIVTEAVLDGTADLALTIRPPEHKELRYQFLMSDVFVAVGDKAAGLHVHDEVDWSILTARPFIAFNKGSSIRMMTDAAFMHAGIPIEPQYECGELATVGGMLSAGLGITALPKLALSHLLAKRIVHRKLKSPVMTRSLGIVTSSRRSLSPAAREFVAHLTGQAKRIMKDYQ